MVTQFLDEGGVACREGKVVNIEAEVYALARGVDLERETQIIC